MDEWTAIDEILPNVAKKKIKINQVWVYVYVKEEGCE